MNKSVTILAQSEYYNDPRVLKQSISASQNGFDVDVFCYQYIFRDFPFEEKNGNINIHRIVCMGKNHTTLLDRFVKFGYDVFSLVPFVYSKLAGVGFISFGNLNYARYLKLRASIIADKVFFYCRGGRNYPVVYYDVNEMTKPNKSSQMPKRASELYLLILNLVFSYFLSNIDIYSKARYKKSDIYHATDLVTLLAGFLLKKRNGGKLVYDTHELWIDSIDNYPPLLKKFLKYYEGFLIRRADAVITVNESIANELVQRYNINPPLVALNCPFYSESKNMKDTYDEFKLLYHGVFIKDRGLEEIITSMQYVSDNCKLYLRGYDGYVVRGVEGDYIKSLKEIVNVLNLNNRVIFLDPVEMVDMVKSIDNYDIGMMPYVPSNMNQLYASPNKTFEYMMGGLAVSVSNIPEQVRFVVNNFVGMSFEPRDPKDIARVINVMISDADALKQMKKNALYYAKNNYNWEIQGEKIVRLYESII
jgi:glycosyltransferase involved in cell wall biosynthesis